MFSGGMNTNILLTIVQTQDAIKKTLDHVIYSKHALHFRGAHGNTEKTPTQIVLVLIAVADPAAG